MRKKLAIGCALFCARHSPASSTRAYDLIENEEVPDASVKAPDELTDEQIAAFKKLEAEMTSQDELIISTANAKNELETYCYTANEKISGLWKDFGTSQEKDAIESLCGQISMWLYDEGSDVTRGEYEAKLKSIKDLAQVLHSRCYEWDATPPLVAALQRSIAGLRQEVKNEKYDHIAPEELQKVLQYCDDAQNYLEPKLADFNSRTKTSSPVFLSSDLKMRNDNLLANSKKILDTPKPQPKKEEPKPKPEEPKPEEPKANATEQQQSEEQSANGPTVEMDTDVD
jgi:molecular chaperone DnaK (HSP70)